MHGFLDSEELHELTGFKRAAEQRSWLTDRAIPYQDDGKRVLVLWQHVERWISGPSGERAC